jgi:hypothetical protein
MRIFRVENDQVKDEVKSMERLAGVYDGVQVATKSGDGQYDLDFGDGSVMRISVRDGMPTGVGPQSVRNVNLDDMPHKAWDREQTQDQTRSSVSQFGVMFGDEDGDADSGPANQRGWDETRPAVEEF